MNIHRPILARSATAPPVPRDRQRSRAATATRASHARQLQAAGAFALALALGVLGLACQPSIGDACVLSTDCSQRGDRLCDTSQSGGYCTVFNCVGDGCPEEASCVVFSGRIPGCLYSDRSIARTARSFCMRACKLDTDCRAGYVCRDPRGAALEGLVLDTDQTRFVCVPSEASPVASVAPAAPAPVCSAAGPVVPPIVGPEAGPPEAGPAQEAGVDAGLDASRDAADGGG